MARLAVIVVNWNGRDLLEECLLSLSRQTLRDLEVVLVDNGSSDGSVEFVQKRFPEVRLVALEQNLGFSAGNNRGIEATSSEFIALLNNDAVADPGWAANLLAAAGDPAIGIAASKVLLYGERELLDSAGDGMTVVGAGFKRGHRQPAGAFQRDEAVFGASGCAMLLRRAALEDLGLLDEDFFFSYEDADLSFRAQLRGWKCVFAADAIVYHKLNSSIGGVSSDYVYYGQRNVEYVFFKNMPAPLMWKYLPAHVLNGIIGLAYFTLRGRLPAFLRAKVSFLGSIGVVRRKRRLIQGRRTVDARRIESMLEKRWLRSRLSGK